MVFPKMCQWCYCTKKYGVTKKKGGHHFHSESKYTVKVAWEIGTLQVTKVPGSRSKVVFLVK